MRNLQTLLDRLEALFGSPAAITGFPGGQSRKTLLCKIEDQTYAVSERRSPGRAKLEEEILRVLGPRGLSPNVIRRDGELVVQEYVEGIRLSEALDQAGPDRAANLLDAAAKSLLQIHSAGLETGIASRVPRIGQRPGWTADLAAAPARLAETLGLAVPDHDFGTLLHADPSTPRVLNKWDARPGNAIVRPDGRICWFDWEHAGSRRQVDDLVWLFADEWTPDADAVIDRQLAALQQGETGAQAPITDQFRAFGVAHSSIRLSLILSRKGDGPWWDHAASLKYDRVGVTRTHAQRVADRAGRWASETPCIQGLAPMFSQMRDRILDS